MRSRLPLGARALCALAVLSGSLLGQSNGDPAIDVGLGALDNLTMRGRTGTFPTGLNGLSMATTSCNLGTVVVPWESAMDPDHPFIAFLLAKDDGTRLRQISNRSYVKHGFFALEQDLCSPCQGGDPENGTFLGLGCSDTYTASTNGNRTWLGPPDEIDPWTGSWDPVCSYFDAGDPAIVAPFDCDGNRSLNSAQTNQFNDVKNRMEVLDADLVDNGPERFYYQGQYVIAQEVEAKRANNLGWRETQPSWSGSAWTFTNQSSLSQGSILNAWTGAQVSSATNGTDDGRVYVAVKVTGPVDGLYRYEYAVHNRDNARGVASFELPVCPEATVVNLGTSDVDRIAGNEWAATVSGGVIEWSTATNPIGWNSFFNFWFDSDAAPVDAVNATLDAFVAGPGAGSLAISTRAPLGSYNHELGPGCSFGAVPRLFADGAPAQATLGNASFALRATGMAPSTIAVFYFSPFEALIDFGGCFGYVSAQSLIFRVRTTNAQGEATLALPIPPDATLEGVDLSAQLLELDPAGGPYADDFDLSNGLRVRVGDALSSCP